jgi:hypothetical protein
VEINADEIMEIGTWVGRRQALAMVAGGCSAADAKCLRTLREQKKYRQLGMTWEQFCKERLGISRSTADYVIALDKELGSAYFTFAQVTGATPDQFRKLLPAISGHKLLHAGEEIPIDAEHAPRLAVAVADLTRTEPESVRRDEPRDEMTRTVDRVERAIDKLVDTLDGLRGAQFTGKQRGRLKTVVIAGAARLKLSEADIP